MSILHFKKGALHKQLGISPDKKIPYNIMQAALNGSKGPLAKKRAEFAHNVLTGGRKK